MMKNNNFWQEYKKKKQVILALAPLAGFTDSTFRSLVKDYGADVVYSEMASVAALYYGGSKRDGALETKELLKFKKKERPYVVQIFGSLPQHFAQAARIITQEIKPDGLDINFGCPVPKIIKQGAGSALMLDLKRARAVIEAVLENTNLPVSIKIRARVKNVSALEFVKYMSDLPIAALMIHGRSFKQGFSGAVNHALVKEVRPFFSGLILTNGGINSFTQAHKALEISQADGLGLGRGALGRPWLFQEIKEGKEINLSSLDILGIILKQAQIFVAQKGEKSLPDLRKHLVWYVQGFPQASKLRAQLVAINSLADIEKIINNYKEENYDTLD
ncbi:MAG: tRNA-dihydrouridine synthase [Patescibacteria group bacterium]|nr:tRNA-dihydrouridine synthase [Patescibacteria group bacterium]